LIEREAVLSGPPWVNVFQESNKLIFGGGNDFTEAADLLSGFLGSLIGSAAPERNTLNDLVEAKKTVESAVYSGPRISDQAIS
jgi:hypothetical protein